MEKVANEIWRYERKFPSIISNYDKMKEVISVHPAFFNKVFSPRKIHNIYFDTLNLSAFHENVDGNNKRKKTRIRWYENKEGQFTQPILEIKIKENLLGRKLLFPLKSKNLAKELFVKNNIKDLIRQCKEIPLFNSNGHYRPIFHSTYHREYYLSNCQKYRLTLDKNLEYESIKGQPFLLKQVKDDHLVIELKYDQNQDDFAAEFGQYLPLSKDKFSKYVMGVLLLQNKIIS